MVPGHLLCPNSPSVTHTDARGQSELSLSLRTTGISVKAKLPGGGGYYFRGLPAYSGAKTCTRVFHLCRPNRQHKGREHTPQQSDVQATDRALLSGRRGASPAPGLMFQHTGGPVSLFSHCPLAENYFCPIISF